MNKLFFLSILTLLLSGCAGINYPATSNVRSINKASLSWYTILNGVSIEKDQKIIKQKWDKYYKRLESYIVNNPNTDKTTLENMKLCQIAIGMKEEQLSFMAKPSTIFDTNIDEEVYVYHSDWGNNQWIEDRITIKDHVIIKIEEQNRAFGW